MEKEIKEVYDFIKGCGTYYLATAEENGQARVRPFGTIDIFDGALYIQTGKSKEVGKQLLSNPKIEICCFNGKQWLRVTASASCDDRTEAKKHMLDAYPNLRGNYDENDENTAVFRLSGCKAVFASFTDQPKTYEF